MREPLGGVARGHGRKRERQRAKQFEGPRRGVEARETRARAIARAPRSVAALAQVLEQDVGRELLVLLDSAPEQHHAEAGDKRRRRSGELVLVPGHAEEQRGLDQPVVEPVQQDAAHGLLSTGAGQLAVHLVEQERRVGEREARPVRGRRMRGDERHGECSREHHEP